MLCLRSCAAPPSLPNEREIVGRRESVGPETSRERSGRIRGRGGRRRIFPGQRSSQLDTRTGPRRGSRRVKKGVKPPKIVLVLRSRSVNGIWAINQRRIKIEDEGRRTIDKPSGPIDYFPNPFHRARRSNAS